MCGIAGILDPTATGDLSRTIRKMTECLIHRGPDGGDVWTDDSAGVALGHRRLAIIDLSEAGHQPMISSCGRLVLSYNGEIYNAPELRTELVAKGRVFRGHSDTEVIVEGAAEWGLAALLPRLIGMFALALWDRNDRCLTLARDRFGIKPLYWSDDRGRFLFGSELKALTAHPDFDREIDRNAVAAYLRFCYVPSPQSIYRAARKLEAFRYRSSSSVGALRGQHERRGHGVGRPAARFGSPPHGGRCSTRRPAFGWHRQLNHHGVDAGPVRATGKDIHDWVRAAWL
jgi:asparagine synthase (glutamine-hydrolysing)